MVGLIDWLHPASFPGAGQYRGGEGPLRVARGTSQNPLHRVFLDAGVQAGYAFTEDMNGHQQEGFGWMDMTIHKGRRWNMASAYLSPAHQRRVNLNVETRALTHRVIFNKTRAIGVEYEKEGTIVRAEATKEVILCGGAVNSPQILMLSGVGDAEHLKQLGITPVAHVAGIGQNLQDHLQVYLQYVSVNMVKDFCHRGNNGRLYLSNDQRVSRLES